MLNWNHIDTVLLDMDGTLLDLHFDNYFWLSHLPQRYAQIHKMDLDSASRHLQERISAHEGTLAWYCLDFWSRELGVDIRELKEEIKHKIQVRPFAHDFLQRLRDAGKKTLLITNAHPLSLELKLEVTAIDRLLDIVISSHQFQSPKEEQQFWQQLVKQEQFDPARALFIDDSPRILQSARDFGIGQVVGIHQPDSQSPRTIDSFPAIHHFDEIMPPPKGDTP